MCATLAFPVSGFLKHVRKDLPCSKLDFAFLTTTKTVVQYTHTESDRRRPSTTRLTGNQCAIDLVHIQQSRVVPMALITTYISFVTRLFRLVAVRTGEDIDQAPCAHFRFRWRSDSGRVYWTYVTFNV